MKNKNTKIILKEKRKRNDLLIHATTLMNFKIIMLNVRS